MLPDLQTSIKSALQAIAPLSSAEEPTTDFRDGHLALLKTLGYERSKTIPIQGAKPATFLEMLEAHAPDANFDPKKALYADWKIVAPSADIAELEAQVDAMVTELYHGKDTKK